MCGFEPLSQSLSLSVYLLFCCANSYAEAIGLEPTQRFLDVDSLSKRGRYQFRLIPPEQDSFVCIPTLYLAELPPQFIKDIAGRARFERTTFGFSICV